MNITTKVRKLVEIASRKKTNFFGYGAYSHHFVPVVKYAKLLAKKLGADLEIVELAGWLHDYSSIVNKDLYQQHHIHSAQMAGEILSKYNYPLDKIEKIQHCILTHRGSKNIKRRTLEAKILASADAMSHFDKVQSLFYLAYVRHELDIDTGSQWVLDKLERSWQKIILPEARAMVRDRYQAIKLLTK